MKMMERLKDNRSGISISMAAILLLVCTVGLVVIRFIA